MSFQVDDPGYIITFIVMAITSIVTGTLMNKFQASSKEAKEKELETSALFNLSSHFTDAKNIDDITSFALNTISLTFNSLCALIRFDSNGKPFEKYLQQKSKTEQVKRETTNPELLVNKMHNLLTDHDESNSYYDYPLYNNKKLIAVLRVPIEDAKYFTDSQNKLLHSMLESIAIAMDSFLLEQEKEKIREETQKEQYRSNLLRSISHDLRTPLTEIIGTSEILIDISENQKEINELSKEIKSSAEWLHSLVENILNLTKIQNGKLVINKTVESMEELAGSAALIIEKRYPGRIIDINLPDQDLFVKVDARLINQVLVNLLDNACKHTKKDQHVGINISQSDDLENIIVEVYDEGTGIKEKDIPYLFQTFYTSKDKTTDSSRGVGLGLAICESIIKAHGGTISCCNREEGGASFKFNLLVKESQNEI